jgi:hypothetical protein
VRQLFGLLMSAAPLFPAPARALQLPAPDSELCRSNLVVVGTVQRREPQPHTGEVWGLATLAVEQTIHGQARPSVTIVDDAGVESPPIAIGTRLLLILWEQVAPNTPIVADPYNGPIMSAWAELDATMPLPDPSVARAAWYSRCAPVVVFDNPDRSYGLLHMIVDALQPMPLAAARTRYSM